MTIEAKIIADSVSPAGIRLTTMQLRYPRFVHAELMTHRVFSRNASSSRAIPVERMIADLRRDPAMPVYWGSNKPGMQAGAELTDQEVSTCRTIWLNSMENAIHSATQLVELGLHKQIANRILEPWVHINVVVTSTEWENFYELRCHPDAQPEMRILAEAMRAAHLASEPLVLSQGDWHLPYVSTQNWADAAIQLKRNRVTRDEPTRNQKLELLIAVSVARCARVSYLTHDGRPTTVEEDLALYQRLVGGVPLHASPAEHQATPDEKLDNEFDETHGQWLNSNLHGNFSGWCQHRKMLETKPK